MSATTEQRAKELWELAEQVNLVAQAMIARAWDSGYAADPHAEGEALVALRVDAAVAQDDGVDHARAEDRHPAAATAGRAAPAVAHDALDVERHGGLGEGGGAGPGGRRGAGAEERGGELVAQATQ